MFYPEFEYISSRFIDDFSGINCFEVNWYWITISRVRISNCIWIYLF